MQERRKYARLSIPLEVEYTIKGKKAVKYKSVTKNISPGGARFITEEELPQGEILNIEIKLPAKEKPIPIKARVVWSKKISHAEKQGCDAGFEFIEIPEESKSLFFQYLCNLMYDQLKKIE